MTEQETGAPTGGRPADVAAEEVLDQLPVVAAAFDTGLRCRYANAAALRWFGTAGPQPVLGRTLRELLPAEVYAVHLPHARAALAGVPQHFDRLLPDGHGGHVPVDVVYLPRVRHREVTGFLVQVLSLPAGSRVSRQAAVAAERERIAAGVGALVGRRLHGAALELSAALQPRAEGVEDRVRAALRQLDAAVHEARRLVHPGPGPSPTPETDDDRELRRTRVLLGRPRPAVPGPRGRPF
jgi:signal transduction histidine kinase